MPVKQDFDNFDPNADGLWLTVTPFRVKASMKRGGAMTVFTNANRARMYQGSPSGFVLVAEKDPTKHSGRCDYCGEDAKQVAQRSNSRWARAGVWRWRKESGKIADPLQLEFVCAECDY